MYERFSYTHSRHQSEHIVCLDLPFGNFIDMPAPHFDPRQDHQDELERESTFTASPVIVLIYIGSGTLVMHLQSPPDIWSRSKSIQNGICS